MAHTLLGLLDKKSIQIKENGDIIYYKNGTFSHSLWDKHADVEKIIPKGIRQEFKDKVYLPLKNYWSTKYHNMGETANKIANAFGFTMLPFSPVSHEGNEVYFMQRNNVVYYLKFKYNSEIVSLGQFYIGAMAGIHKEPKNKFYLLIAQNWARIAMANKLPNIIARILEELLGQIDKGIRGKQKLIEDIVPQIINVLRCTHHTLSLYALLLGAGHIFLLIIKAMPDTFSDCFNKKAVDFCLLSDMQMYHSFSDKTRLK